MASAQTPGSKPPIYLLDSMAFIFRAYHAMQRQRPMSTRTGIPTAATYVFVNMINKLRKDFAPVYLAAVYDVGAPVHRNELATQLKDVKKFNIKTQQFETTEYGGYKANRVETPPDLIQQQPYIRRALEAFRIPILYYEGFEADDVIGTLSCKLSALGHHVYVVSSDKDMMQLVNDNVSILNPTKDNLILDPAGVEGILGVPPERVIDVMALRGDAIDNIPGAPGIGDKGSVELIQQFGTVEGALDRAEEVKKKTYRESLLNNRENIMLSKELVTIHTGVPIEYSIEAMRTQPVDNAACRELFSELEFTTLLKELAPAVDNTPLAFNLKATEADLTALLAAARETDPETGKVRGFSLAMFEDARALAEETAAEPAENVEEAEPAPAENMSLFGAPADETPAVVEEPKDAACRLGLAVAENAAIEVSIDFAGLRDALEDAALPKDLHDLKAVLRALEPHGITLAGVRDDVMLLSYLVNPTHGSHTLPDVVARFTNRALTPVVKGVVSPTLLPESANAIHRVAPILRKQVEEAGLVVHEIPKDDPALGGAVTHEMLFPPAAAPVVGKADGPLVKVYETIDLPLVPVLLRMEEAGVRIDPAVLNEMSSRLAVEIDNLAEKIYADSGHRFNINSPKQLGDVLFNKMDLPKPMKYGKGKVVSTAQDVLEELAENHPIAALVIEHRQLQKLKSTYLDQLPSLSDREGRIHTTFNQVGTATGRLSSTNPNLQNIPTRTAIGREIRAAFIAAPGNLLMSADYSQIELRLMAHFSQDPLLLNAYRTGQDIHTLTAAEVFGVDAETMDKETRARAKAVNFGIVYGISPFGLAAQLGIDQKVARTYIETYYDRYKGIKRFIDETLETVRLAGAVSTHFGRVRPIPDIQSRNPNMRGFAERTAINTPLQGTAADLIKLAMISLDREIRARGLKSRMTLQVHDELLFDVVPSEAEEMQTLVQHEMENVAEFSIPIVADIGLGDNWRDIK
ncbi:DNA polymerase I [Granulicella tundricola]|uniref:DNA polymerase I n=1 Tax=Granulicella tundricola (strain ATCC BAA-1859 / DSM 23138 / MP5ACTX9) TaxID=1198114 RepID=E8X0D7_GRATM|nr:DNA polymerase I [Granulicella tundricola]ADW67801.1 DNA polymerase I [Granulicella tundricola MP5ACTX9]